MILILQQKTMIFEALFQGESFAISKHTWARKWYRAKCFPCMVNGLWEGPLCPSVISKVALMDLPYSVTYLFLCTSRRKKSWDFLLKVALRRQERKVIWFKIVFICTWRNESQISPRRPQLEDIFFQEIFTLLKVKVACDAESLWRCSKRLGWKFGPPPHRRHYALYTKTCEIVPKPLSRLIIRCPLIISKIGLLFKKMPMQFCFQSLWHWWQIKKTAETRQYSPPNTKFHDSPSSTRIGIFSIFAA